MTCGWLWGLRVPDHPGPVLPHPTRQAQLRGSPARLERGRLPRGCEGSTPGLLGSDRGEQPPERRRRAVGGAGNVYRGLDGGPGGEQRSRGGPLPGSPLQSLQGPRPAHPRDTYGLAGCSAGGRGPGRYIPRRWRWPAAEGRLILSALPAPEGPRDLTASPPQPRHLPGATSPLRSRHSCACQSPAHSRARPASPLF